MKIKKYILGILISTSLISCKDYLDTTSDSSLDSSNIFSSYGMAVSAVDGILAPMMETNSYRGRWIQWYGINTDCEMYKNSDASTSDARTAIANYTQTSTNTRLNIDKGPYQEMFAGIEQANLAIEGLREYADLTDESMQYLLGRALTYRAIYYHDLVRVYGPVPARFEHLSSDNMYIAKSSVDVIYAQLLDDLLEAEDYIPWPNENSYTTTSEDINLAFVKGLRARIALDAGGYSAYPSSYTEASSDYENRTSETLDQTEMWTIAYNECKDIHDQAGTYFDLEEDYQDIWTKVCSDEVVAGGESLWEIPFSDTRGRVMYTYGGYHSEADDYVEKGLGGQIIPTPYLYYDFDEDDLRRDITCIPFKWGKYTDSHSGEEVLGPNPSNASQWYFGKLRYEWTSRDSKFSGDDGINKVYMRYAEVLLMYAEAANNLGYTSEAGTYLAEVRGRAFSADDYSTKVTQYISERSTQDLMQQAIEDEYKYEFSGEAVRKECLIRWGKLADYVEEAQTKMTNLRTQVAGSDYEDVPTVIWWKTSDDGLSIDVYGLNRGETTDQDKDVYTKKTWINVDHDDDEEEYLSDNFIDGFCQADDVNARMFWPIPYKVTSASNNTLFNSYGY